MGWFNALQWVSVLASDVSSRSCRCESYHLSTAEAPLNLICDKAAVLRVLEEANEAFEVETGRWVE